MKKIFKILGGLVGLLLILMLVFYLISDEQMSLNNQITIEKPVDEIWNVVAENFDKAEVWMAAVPRSEATNDGAPLAGAPMCGRICRFDNAADGPYVDEKILAYDKGTGTLSIEVIPKNAPMPMDKNIATFLITSIDDDSTNVELNSEITLNTMGRVMYPMVKSGISSAMDEVLEELKHYLETGEPHPRKLAATS